MRIVLVLLLASAVACGDETSPEDTGARDTGTRDTGTPSDGGGGRDSSTRMDTGGGGTDSGPLPDDLPRAGNPDGPCDVPAEARAADTSTPDHVIGDGTAASCSSEAVVSTIAMGGIITFNCGPDPLTIELEETARIFNNTGPRIVIDGGGLVTLSGMGERRILYMNTCDESLVWTTPNCDNQDHPRLTLQNLTFVDGNAIGEEDGGGAVFASGGRLNLVNTRFFRNRCAEVGPDIGGAAVRSFQQFNNLPLYVVNSTFGGREGLGNYGSNGGALSSIGVSWTVINSVLSYNDAIGNGGNPAVAGTPGGGSGGAIYNDGNTMTLSICGSVIEHNTAVQHGSAIFFVSNDRSGNIVVDRSTITNNTGGSWYDIAPQISGHPETGFEVTDSTIED